MAMAIIGDVFPDERRGTATGSLMSAFALASVVGVPFGLYLGTRYGWHAPFFMLVGLGSAALLVGVRALPPLRGHLDTSKPAGHPVSEMVVTTVPPEPPPGVRADRGADVRGVRRHSLHQPVPGGQRRRPRDPTAAGSTSSAAA